MINEIGTDEKIKLDTNSDILGEMCNFYEKLFSSNSIEDNDKTRHLKDCKINPLTENDKNLSDSFPTLDECIDAVMNLKANRMNFIKLSGKIYHIFFMAC